MIYVLIMWKFFILILCVVKVSLGIVMVVVSEVFLNSEMMVEDSEGSILCSISGVMMFLWICILVRLMVSFVLVKFLGIESRLVWNILVR